MEIGVFISLYILGASIFGVFCAILASRKGEDGRLWFLLGCLFNFVTLIVLAGLPTRERNVLHHTSKRRMQDRLSRKFPRAVSAGIAGAIMCGGIAIGTAFGSSLVFSANGGNSIEDRVSALESWAQRASLEINHWKVYGNPGKNSSSTAGDGSNNNSNNDVTNGDTQPPGPTPEPTPIPKKSCTHKGSTYEDGEWWTDETEYGGYRWRNTYECRDGRRVSWGSEKIGPAS